jgi:hypothetical protein
MAMMRPAGELILLAELVGLIVLERHQLFEPVSDRPYLTIRGGTPAPSLFRFREASFKD